MIVKGCPPQTVPSAHPLQDPIPSVTGIDELGFLPGWGSTVGRVRESFQLLLDIVQVSSERRACGCVCA